MRHGDALGGIDDYARPLSDAGRAEAARAGVFLERAGAAPRMIYHSDLLRAVETAELVAEKLGIHSEMEKRKDLRPECPWRSFADDFMKNNMPSNALVVGHMPFVGNLASYLLCGNESMSIKFTTGSIICVERSEAGWTLRYHMPAKMIGKICAG